MMTLVLASRYLAGRKLRTALTTLAIVFGVLVVFGMNTLIPAFMAAFTSNMLAAGGRVDATVTLKTGDVFDEAVAGRVAAVDGVQTISPLIDRTVNVPANYFDGDPNRADAIGAVTLQGIDPGRASAMRAFPVQTGRFLEAGDGAVTVISQSLADAIGVGLGQTLRLPAAAGETELTVVGLLPPRALPGNEAVLVSLAQAQAMLNMPGKINTVEANFGPVNEDRRAAIEQALLAELGEAYQLDALSSNAELLTNLGISQMIFSLLGVLALLMGGFIIFNTFRTIVVERRRDIGMLRAVGASRRTILSLVLAEGLVQGVLGTALGLLLGYLLGLLMTSLLAPMLRQYLNMTIAGPVVTVGLVVGSALLGVGVTLAAGLLPALGASRLSPLEALRPAVGRLNLRRMAGLGFWAGVTMLVLAVAALLTRSVALLGLGGVLFVLGLILVAPALITPIANLFSALAALAFARSGTAQLAEGNLSRQPSRTAITASTTLIGIAILVVAGSMISSVTIGFERVLRKSLGSDYVLVPPAISVWGTNVGAGPALTEALRAVEGVEVVSSLRFAPTQANDLAISLLGIDPATYPLVSGLDFSAGDEAAYTALDSGRNIIVNPVLASTAAVKVGDDLTLLTPAGSETYRVVAVAGDYLNAKIASGYISHGRMAADFNREEDVLIQVNLNPRADRAAAEAGLREALAAYPQFRLIDGQAYIEENLAIFNAAFAGLVALVLFLAIPSLIAMINTLAIGVLERTREIGMLRAVGATRGQVRTIVLVEALILSIIGTVFGVSAGMYLGYLLVQTMSFAGFPMEYAFPAPVVVLALATGLVFGALAAIIPARQAARLPIVQALRYE